MSAKPAEPADHRWMDHARCATRSPEIKALFHSEKASDQGLAKIICRNCPVLFLCYHHAITHDEEGVWGATTRRERLRIQRTLIQPKTP